MILAKPLPTYQLLAPIIAKIKNVFYFSDVTIVDAVTWTLTSCNTLWLSVNSTITIGANTYTVKDIVCNQTITITGIVEPTSPGCAIIAIPNFFHGTIIEQSAAMSKIPNIFDKVPMIYLKEITKEDFSRDPMSAVERTSNVVIFFGCEADPTNWQVLDYDRYAIEPMRNLAEAFYQACKTSPIVNSLWYDYSLFDLHRWGVSIVQDGTKNTVSRDNLSAVMMTSAMMFNESSACCNQ